MTAAQIAEKIKKAGALMTLTRRTAGTYDPTTGNYTGAANTTYSVYGLRTSANLLSKPDEGLLSAGLIRVGDSKVLLAAGVVVPRTEDTLTIGGVVFTIVALNELSPAGVDLLYTAWVRK
jgi:hypothetical protein